MTSIAWTSKTWNPIVAYDIASQKRGWFCQKVSAGCTNCYAEKMNQWRGNGHGYRVGELAKVRIELHEPTLQLPTKWRQPSLIFPCSMTDLFMEEHSDQMIDRIISVMAQTPRHTYQVLTKRPQRMCRYSSALERMTPRDRSRRIATSMYANHPAGEMVLANLREEHIGDFPWPLENVWFGATMENQEEYEERSAWLQNTPAAVRWVSFEPLLEPIKLHSAATDLSCGTLGPIDWAVIGGESVGGRPMDLEWVRSLVGQLRGGPIPAKVFVKQVGSHYVREHHLTDKKGEDMREWPDDLRIREYPTVPIVSANA